MPSKFFRSVSAVSCLIGLSGILVGLGVSLVVRVSLPGSMIRYDIMALVLNAMLAVGFIRREKVGFLFLTIVIWIAFWLRLSLKILNDDVVWQEPIGSFDFSSGAWDEVAAVATIGALAVLLVGLFWPSRFDGFNFPKSSIKVNVHIRFLLWNTVIATTILFIGFNELFGVSRGGLRAGIELPSPWQGGVVWLISIAPVLGVITLYYYDVISRRSLWGVSLLFVLVGVAIAYSTSSRGAFVIQGGVLLLVLFFRKNQIPWLTGVRFAIVVMMFVFGFLAAALFAQQRRIDTLPGYDVPVTRDKAFFRRLVIDRWVGLEGLMATVSYGNKSHNLFFEFMRERRTQNVVDSFTDKIGLSGFDDVLRYQYATLPGGFAFLYLSGSLGLVFLGSALFSILILIIEFAIHKYTGNPFLAGFLSVSGAMIFVQMGVGLIQQMNVLAFSCFVGVLGSCVVRRILNVSSKGI